MFYWTSWNVSYVVIDKETGNYLSSIATQTISGFDICSKRSAVAEFARQKKYRRNILSFAGKGMKIISVNEVTGLLPDNYGAAFVEQED